MALPSPSQSASVLKTSKLAILKSCVPGSAAVALAVFVLLGCMPPHGLDIAIERLFYVKGDFLWHNVPLFEFIHSYAKTITALVFAGALFVVIKTRFYLKAPVTQGASGKALYVIAAMALCLILTSVLKKLTGMSCPWDLTLFGGSDALSTPLKEISRGNFSGKCWPSGFAGSAFCLYALCFILPAGKKRLLAFSAVTLLGFAFGLVQMGRGAHFLSHIVAAGCLDYALCAVMWRVFDAGKERVGPDADATPQSFASNFAGITKPRQQSLAKRLMLLLAIALWWSVVSSLPFWQEAVSPELSFMQNARFLFACGILLVCAHAALLALFAALLPGRIFKGVTVLLTLLAAAGGTFAIRYHAAMTPEMLRNAFETDPREASELLNLNLVLLFAMLSLPPSLLTIKCWRPLSGLRSRLKLMLCVPLLTVLGVTALFTDFSSAAIYMREHHDARYFLMPSAVVSSSVRTFVSDTSAKNAVRSVVDPHPILLASRHTGKPVVVVTVVGETVRAANWGLSGYSRDTTPRLRELGVVNFKDVTSCGTDTATSVPCIFSRVGRRDYSRADILGEEPLPVLLQRAGVHSKWIDNQSGSKGAAEGIKEVTAATLLGKDDFSKKCQGGVCPDGVLPVVLGKELDAVHESAAFYLHMMGSHGPAYAARYPEEFNRWGPVCQSADLRQCDLKELRNAYDNTILYTDAVLAEIIESLRAHEDLDTALIYFSDHGESLGENGFFLHGAPYAIASEHQTKVPLIMWFSDGFKERTGLDEKCLLKRAGEPASHDNLWSTLMGLNGVSSFTYMQEDDLLSSCISER